MAGRKNFNNHKPALAPQIRDLLLHQPSNIRKIGNQLFQTHLAQRPYAVDSALTPNDLALIESFKTILIKEGRALSEHDLGTTMRQELLSMKANITAITNWESMVGEMWKTEARIKERVAKRTEENEEAAKRKGKEKTRIERKVLAWTVGAKRREG